jgi:hypothetical protein
VPSNHGHHAAAPASVGLKAKAAVRAGVHEKFAAGSAGEADAKLLE